MRLSPFPFLLSSVLLGLGGVPPLLAAEPVVCRWADVPPVIDGDDDDSAWAEAVSVGPFQRAWMEDPAARVPKTSTEAKLCWDGEHLYFFARMEDGDLFAQATEQDGDLWFDDVFELFFKPAEDFPGYYEFEFNPHGAVLDLYLPQRGSGEARRFKHDFPFHVKTAVKLRGTLNKWTDKDEGWNVEGKIPWSDFIRAGGRPKAGEVWKFAACRYDYSVDFQGPNLSSNAPLQRLSFHRYEDYLPLRFEGPRHAFKPHAGHKVKGRPGKPSPYKVENAYPRLKGVGLPITAAAVPRSGVMLAVTQARAYGASRIIRFEDKPDVDAFTVVRPAKGAVVTYDFAFHPRFGENGFLFLGWNDGKVTHLSRFRFDAETFSFVPASETRFLSWEGNGHNGAAIDFGPDGFLYVTTGDGSSDSDVLLNGQRTDVLHAKLLRIDVDKPADGKPYSVPADNPFVSNPAFAPETWAYGFRNPWRLDVDERTGQIWVGNNGQDLWEQAYLVTKGANYGWSVYEGSRPFYPNRKLGPTPVSKPALEHSHAESRSLTGGLVYHGEALADLRGHYLYGDYSTGKIWAARYDGEKVSAPRELADTSFKITDFNLDTHGELLVLDHGDAGSGGGLYRLVPTAGEATASDFPQTLSATGLYADVAARRLAAGVLPYAVNAEQWADGARQRRALVLPAFPDETGAHRPDPIGYRSRGAWKVPEGSVLLKTLSLPTPGGGERPIETQLLTFQDGDWAAYAYKWNEAGSDATLVPEAGEDVTLRLPGPDGSLRSQAWRHVSRAECMFCHSRAAGFALSLNTLQLNRDHLPGAAEAYGTGKKAPRNQLALFDRLGLFTDNWAAHQRARLREQLLQAEPAERRDLPAAKNAANARVRELFGGSRGYPHATSDRLALPPTARNLAESYPRQADPFDETATLDARARSYLQTNCANCHQGAGGGNAVINLAHHLPLEKTETLDLKPKHLDFGISRARLLAPGKPERSILLHRMTLTTPGQMPPIGRKTPDHKGAALIRQWIAKQ